MHPDKRVAENAHIHLLLHHGTESGDPTGALHDFEHALQTCRRSPWNTCSRESRTAPSKKLIALVRAVPSGMSFSASLMDSVYALW